MSLWQNRDCVQESRSQSNRRGASDYLFSIYTILDRFCIIFNRIWRSSLVCAGKTRITTVSPLASWRSVVYEVRNSLTFLCWNLFNCSLKIQLYVQVWKKDFNWRSCGNLSGKYVIFGHFWTRVSLYESFGSCSWNSKLSEIEKKEKLRKIVNSYLFLHSHRACNLKIFWEKYSFDSGVSNGVLDRILDEVLNEVYFSFEEFVIIFISLVRDWKKIKEINRRVAANVMI